MLNRTESCFNEKLSLSKESTASSSVSYDTLKDLMLFSYIHGEGTLKKRLHFKLGKHAETLALSRNLGKWKHLDDYFQSMRQPFSPSELHLVGKENFLRITRPVVLSPRGNTGVCVGASLSFLSYYIQAGSPVSKREIQQIASLFSGGVPRTAVAVQNLYCGLFTDESLLSDSEYSFYQILFQNLPCSKNDWNKLSVYFTEKVSSSSQDKKIFFFLKKYLLRGCKSDLREYLMLCISEDGGELDAKSYALIRYIAACYLSYCIKESVLEKKFVIDAFCVAASLLKLELEERIAENLSFESMIQSLIGLPKGAFLLSLDSHSRAWVVLGNDEYVLFDPNKGTQWISGTDKLEKVLKKELAPHFRVREKAKRLPIGRLTKKYQAVSRDVLVLEAFSS